MRRRKLLLGLNVAAGAAVGGRLLWQRAEGLQRAETAVVRAGAYDGKLEETVRRALEAIGFGAADVRGRSVLLKPNLVEPTRAAAHVHTDPVLVRAVAEVFRRWDAREVLVGEGPGHVRDTRWVLDESGYGEMLAEARLPFVDLNYDELYTRPNALGATDLAELHLPRTLQRADLIVSLPKMKTHHWAGVTLSMKNLFGVMPGLHYGWPKNPLHLAGIGQSIVDITATVRPHLAIVDGVVGMEGDGPIMGTPRAAGLIVAGRNLPAVDATTARLMGIDPAGIDYLRAASGRLGPIAEAHIEQRGEPLAALAQRFALPPGAQLPAAARAR